MGAGTLISLDEYLHTSYSPDKEYRDGVLVERNVGDKTHALLQLALGAYMRRRRKQWNIQIYTELRVKVRERWYLLPDVCVYQPDFDDERYPERPPLLWVEILSHDDRMVDVWDKANELIANGVPNVWIVNPNTLDSELRTAEGIVTVKNQTLCVPGTEIVIPLPDVMDE
jgi:Uma2 family endonuclease